MENEEVRKAEGTFEAKRIVVYVYVKPHTTAALAMDIGNSDTEAVLRGENK